MTVDVNECASLYNRHDPSAIICNPAARIVAEMLSFTVHVRQVHNVIHGIANDNDASNSFALAKRQSDCKGRVQGALAPNLQDLDIPGHTWTMCSKKIKTTKQIEPNCQRYSPRTIFPKLTLIPYSYHYSNGREHSRTATSSFTLFISNHALSS